MNLDFVFKSSDHNRYENGEHVSGPHGGAGRAIKVEPNINGGLGYSVSVYNLDGDHPLWQNNLQVGHKQMKLDSQSSEKIVLKGFGNDPMGHPFTGYALSVYFDNGVVTKCVLHLLDRKVDIEYLK